MNEKIASRKAVAMATSIGVEARELGNGWQNLGMRNFNIKKQLEDMELELSIDDQVWQKLLSQLGLWLIDSFDQKIENIQAKVLEQETAIELRKLFGIPLSLLAMPVFVELEKMELLARIDLKTEASNLEKIWGEIKNRILHMMQLFLVEQIEAVEKEEEAHLLALQASQKQAKGIEALSTTVIKVENQFSKKLEELKKKKNLLFENFKKVGGNIPSLIDGSFEATIFKASKQSTQAIVIN